MGLWEYNPGIGSEDTIVQVGILGPCLIVSSTVTWVQTCSNNISQTVVRPLLRPEHSEPKVRYLHQQFDAPRGNVVITSRCLMRQRPMDNSPRNSINVTDVEGSPLDSLVPLETFRIRLRFKLQTN